MKNSEIDKNTKKTGPFWPEIVWRTPAQAFTDQFCTTSKPNTRKRDKQAQARHGWLRTAWKWLKSFHLTRRTAMKPQIVIRIRLGTTLYLLKIPGKWGWLEIGVLAEKWSWWGKFYGFFRFAKEFTDYRSLDGDRNKWGFPYVRKP